MSQEELVVQKEELTAGEVHRRGFMKQALFAALAAGLSGSATASAIPSQSRRPAAQGPLRSTRVLNSTHTKDGNREESTMEIELKPADGSRIVTKNYYKRIEADASYDILISTLIFWYENETSPTPVSQSTKTISVTANKGVVSGNTRLDTVTTTLIQDGVLIKTGPTMMPMLLRNPYEGMSEQDMIHAVITDKVNN